MIGRTEIAAMALQGLLARPGIDRPIEDKAHLAVAYADALLEDLARIPPPASTHESPKEGPPSGCSAGAAGDTREGLQPRDLGGADGPIQRVVCGLAATESAPPPVQVFDCEGRFPIDPPCPTATSFDAATKGRFCLVHIAVDEGARREMHRLHGDRNRPAAKARRIAEALG